MGIDLVLLNCVSYKLAEIKEYLNLKHFQFMYINLVLPNCISYILAEYRQKAEYFIF